MRVCVCVCVCVCMTQSFDSVHIHMTVTMYLNRFNGDVWPFLTIAPPVCSFFVLLYVFCSQCAILCLG